MRSLIVGTAGHIDHGKSALVRALTGTDPDRLKEEKERGITIDLGFAHMEAGGRVVSFIDVPGHERFVRNMLAGAHGIDAALLVVAADESVMPQTREHFHICRLLGIGRGLVALTKCDLADAESQALAEMEVRELVEGSFLQGRPVLRVSARTGEGLDALRAALVDLAGEAAARPTSGLLRLPVDRAFTLRGFGTVVTGTLVSGSLEPGEEVEVLPSGRRARVRGVQVHGAPVERVEAGNRAAVNLAGLEVEDVARGDVLARPGTLRPTLLLDVEVALLPGERVLKDQARLRVHVASAEVLARARLLEGERLEPGRSGLAQLRLEAPVAAGRGDRLILRSYSPSVTIGGARVLDPVPPKRRRVEPPRAASLRSMADAEAAAAALELVRDAGVAGMEARLLAARVTVPLAALAVALEAHPELVRLGSSPGWYLSAEAAGELARVARDELARFHAGNPLRAALAKEELRRRVFARAPAGALEHVLQALAERGEVRLQPDAVALAGQGVRLTAEEEVVGHALTEAVRAAGLAGIESARMAEAVGRDAGLVERMARVLTAEGTLRRVGEGLVLHREALEALEAEVRRRWPPGSRLDVAGFKELTGLSRKYVIPLLEYLDRERVTRRAGPDRVVLAEVPRGGARPL